MSFATFDLETTIRSQFKRKASPFYGINEIVAVGIKHRDEKVQGYYQPECKYREWFTDMLAKSKLLVGFNIKFDLMHAFADNPLNYPAFKRWIVAGGQVWDCQLAEYLLHGMAQEVQIASLDETAPKYGGHLKNDAVKALWQAGIDTINIDRDLLMEYLIGAPGQTADLGDIGNTEKVFIGQLDAIRKRGSLQSVLLNMGALVFTLEAEWNGMYVDKSLGLLQAEELAKELVVLNGKLDEYIPKDVPFTFKWTSRHHQSALIFGGGIKYTTKEPMLDEHGNQMYVQKDALHYVLEDGSTMECTWFEHCMFTEWDGCVPERYSRVEYKSGKNAGEYKTKKVKTNDRDKPKFRNVDKVYQFPGFTTPEPEWASSTEGVYSVSSDVIEALGSRDIPFLKDLAARAALAKDLGTYYITTDPETGEQKGMLTLVGPDGVIHHQLHMVRTVTARLSSSDPNLQNVSGGGKSQVKALFKSRFPGGKIIQSDFTALEVYVQAVLTLCSQLITDLRAGLDMHCVRVSQKENVSYEYVCERAKDEHHPDHKVWAKKRKGAKEFSFQRAYGAGVKKIAASTGMSEEDVQALVDAELKRYPEIEVYYARLTEKIKAKRVPTQRFCQHPQVKGLQCQLGKSHYITPDGKMYSYIESPSPKFIAEKPASKGGTAQSFSPTEIKNYVVQGTGGEWAKAAMWLAVRMFYIKGNFNNRALIVNQVHDAIYLDAAPEVAVEAAALLHACMLEASNLMEFHFKWDMPVGVPTETKYGDSMIEEKSLPEGFDVLVHSYRDEVRKTLIGSHIPLYERIN